MECLCALLGPRLTIGRLAIGGLSVRALGLWISVGRRRLRWCPDRLWLHLLHGIAGCLIGLRHPWLLLPICIYLRICWLGGRFAILLALRERHGDDSALKDVVLYGERTALVLKPLLGIGQT